VSLQAVRRRLDLWNTNLPGIRPHYAVKCNNLRPILEELHRGGAGFDCASADEVRRVVSFGTPGSDIIYANPCKSRNELYKVKDDPIPYMTFDNPSEVEKLPNTTKPILRIFVDDKGGVRIPLNSKFGFPYSDISDLMWREPRVHFHGIAFHVGSDCSSRIPYESAFDTVRQFVSILLNRPDVFTPELLDIGGGFSGSSKNDGFFRELAPYIQNQISTLPFKKVIAEPGRFLAEESCTLQVPVIGKKRLPNGKQSITLDDSVYGMFSGVLFDGFKPVFNCITRKPWSHCSQFTIFGRTCDSADKIAEDVWLPNDIGEADILEVKNIGAYSWVSASEFNGFPLPPVSIQETSS
jgi:ornithine decarboxylase